MYKKTNVYLFIITEVLSSLEEISHQTLVGGWEEQTMWSSLKNEWYVRSTLAKELTVATGVIQSSSNELSTPISVSVKCKQMENLMHIC